MANKQLCSLSIAICLLRICLLPRIDKLHQPFPVRIEYMCTKYIQISYLMDSMFVCFLQIRKDLARARMREGGTGKTGGYEKVFASR